ncbi:MAG: metalloregulator ArsR/SmtB family transcription factor [Propionibacterium sp.]|nr:metalloregulator ArsR/SmtB family transcription factor [Propionibacterium sp.]
MPNRKPAPADANASSAADSDQAEPPDTTGPDDELLDEAAETFAILASPVRLQLLWHLARQPHDVSTLADLVDASVPAISQHLAKLRLADLVTANRDGKRQVYSLDDPHIATLVEQAIDHHRQLREGS